MHRRSCVLWLFCALQRTIPNSVKSIFDGAFNNCTSLTSVTIPNSVTEIGAEAFANSTALKEVNYLGTEEQWNAITIYGNVGKSFTNAHRNYIVDGVYHIGTKEQLLWYANYVNTVDNTASGKLTADIVLNEDVLTADGALSGDGNGLPQWPIITDLRGTFDGDGHTISGLYFDDSSVDYVCFASSLHGEIRNLGIVDSYIRGGIRVAAFAGQAWGSVTNCYNAATVEGKKEIGGIIGYTNGGEVTDCYNVGTISGVDRVGGIAGWFNNGGSAAIVSSFNVGAVSGTSGVGGDGNAV